VPVPVERYLVTSVHDLQPRPVPDRCYFIVQMHGDCLVWLEYAVVDREERAAPELFPLGEHALTGVDQLEVIRGKRAYEIQPCPAYHSVSGCKYALSCLVYLFGTAL